MKEMWDNRRAREDARYAREGAAQEAASESSLLRQIRELYGIDQVDNDLDGEIAGINAQIAADTERFKFDEAARNRIPAARARVAALEASRKTTDRTQTVAARNRTALDGVFGRQRTAALDEGARELDTRFSDTLRSQRQRMAAQGLAGGSADAEQHQDTLSSLLTGRQRLTGAVDTADQGARRSLEDSRMDLERQVKVGAMTDPGSVSALSRASAGVNEAYSNITQQALGGILQNGANTYRETTLADAYGRRGSSAFGMGTSQPSARGTITGTR